MDFFFPNGFHYPEIHIPSLTGEPLFAIGPISYTNAHLTMLIVIAVLTVLSIAATRNMRELPSGIQNFVELLVQGLADFVVSVGGPNSLKQLPLFGTLFLFIVLSNWLSVVPLVGQVPWLHSPTADYHINFAMALISWIAYQVAGFGKHGFGYMKRWLGPIGIIELFSEIMRLLTLTLRLWGNVLGGEIMLSVMAALLFLPGLALPFVGLEVFVGLVQGLVFALLVLMYFVFALESHGEEHHEEAPGSHSGNAVVAHSQPAHS